MSAWPTGVAAATLFLLLWSIVARAETVPPDMSDSPQYAESVMVHLLSADGETDLSLRLARFPHEQRAHVWFHAAVVGEAWSLVDEAFTTSAVATPVTDRSAAFEATQSTTAFVRYSSDARDGAMTGRVTGQFEVNEGRHVNAGTGTVPVSLDLRYVARSRGFLSDSGRWETTGQIEGWVVIGNTRYQIAGDGKWHEQTGNRPGFAPAFTYLNLQNERYALLVIGFRGGARGYLEQQGDIAPVVQLEIEPRGSGPRAFTVWLRNGSSLSGTATEVQAWSVPIEGVRRPGSSVVAETSVGKMWGSLNDWNPQGS